MDTQKISKSQGEQLALLKAEKKLTEMINKINEHINILKVEELQLKANLFSSQNKPEKDPPENKFKMIEIPEFINSQVIDLNVNRSLFPNFDEEYESD